MKMLILLLFPFFSVAQLVHVDDKEIVYKGNVAVPGLSASQVAERLQTSFWMAAKKSKVDAVVDATNNRMAGQGHLKMNMPYHKDRILHFTIQLQSNGNGYTYRIDSVYIVEKRRGWDAERTSGADLVKNMEETGTVAVETERILNEIDLRLQKLLVLLERGVKQAAANGKETGK